MTARTFARRRARIPGLVLASVVAGLALLAAPVARTVLPAPATPTPATPVAAGPVVGTGMVAYAAPAGGIWTIHADGSQRRRVAVDGTQPRWSTDGARLTYLSTAGAEPALVSVAPDGSDPEVLADRVGSGAAFSPEGDRVAMVGFDRRGRAHLEVLELGSGDRTRVPETAPGFHRPAGYLGLDWSPDGTWLAFVADTGEAYDVYSNVTALFTIRVDGTGLRRLTGRDQVMAPRWSPDGSRLLYATTDLSRDGAGSGVVLRSVAADGADDEVVLDRGQTGPGDWSPDGSRVITAAEGLDRYVGDSPPLAGLWQVRSDGTGVRHVARVAGTWPDWGPQSTDPARTRTSTPPGGNRPLVLTMADDAGYDLGVLSADGTVTALTSDGGSQVPDLAPDGAEVRFLRAATNGGTSGWRIGIDGADETRLVDRVRFFRAVPAWDPLDDRLLVPQTFRVLIRDLTTGDETVILRSFRDWEEFGGAAWSDDGEWVAVTAERLNRYDDVKAHGIFVMRADGSHRRLVALTDRRHRLGQVDLTTHGGWLAFTRSRNNRGGFEPGFSTVGPTDVWVVRRDGSDAHEVLATRGMDFAPAWRPDGQQLAVLSDGPAPYGIRPSPGVWLVDRDGSDARLVLAARGLIDLDW